MKYDPTAFAEAATTAAKRHRLRVVPFQGSLVTQRLLVDAVTFVVSPVAFLRELEVGGETFAAGAEALGRRLDSLLADAAAWLRGAQLCDVLDSERDVDLVGGSLAVHGGRMHDTPERELLERYGTKLVEHGEALLARAAGTTPAPRTVWPLDFSEDDLVLIAAALAAYASDYNEVPHEHIAELRVRIRAFFEVSEAKRR